MDTLDSDSYSVDGDDGRYQVLRLAPSTSSHSGDVVYADPKSQRAVSTAFLASFLNADLNVMWSHSWWHIAATRSVNGTSWYDPLCAQLGKHPDDVVEVTVVVQDGSIE